jgi:8-oxo-dGTP diphosphatase
MSRLPELRTRRLILRPLRETDAEAIARLGGQDFGIVRWLTSMAWPYEEGSAEAFTARAMTCDPLAEAAVFAITLGGVFIGVMAVDAPGELAEAGDCPAIGYWLGRPFQGFGYATEAADAAIAWAFSAHACTAVAARVFEENAASRALLRKLGFQPAAITERYARALDRKVRNIVVRLDGKAFRQRRAAA